MFNFLEKKNFNNKIDYKYYIKHIAIIMDGNGRWAEKKGKLRKYGHIKGIKVINSIIKFSINLKLKVLTLYAFSSENWNRPYSEVSELFKLFNKTLKNEINSLNKNNIKLNIIGNIKELDKDFQNNIYKSEEITKNNTGLILNIAINYGGKWDIIESFKKVLNKIDYKILSINDINESIINDNLCINDCPPIDLVIRTGGEKRISNFLLWQIAYSELYFTDVLWPDFNKIDFYNAIKNFYKRNRKFGKLY
ncbi:polyprenyl diphosphate synthase [endosymbiont of Pachyrhynchus infernalis]|uniref:polyprenyl diphosphate synthase n=1 Tax=endosymbiont of Pachyrhynchus infernalis TaxID=1971488 RepID=UPI000DC73540|nr:polyprenyl diphosphate synthase [endosymbiont of Pachyrhynchus infernalis]BBA84798.1 UDP pyrophosphate synthase [endosymbiont of Pachyrhynchus infernalis]